MLGTMMRGGCPGIVLRRATHGRCAGASASSCTRRRCCARRVVDVVLGGPWQLEVVHAERSEDPLPLYCRDAVECRVRTPDGARAKGVRRDAVVSQCSGRTEGPSRMECGKVVKL